VFCLRKFHVWPLKVREKERERERERRAERELYTLIEARNGIWKTWGKRERKWNTKEEEISTRSN
jgi:hypothetical protein